MIYLAGLSIIGFLATDMYLPVFDVMRSDLATSKSNIGASLTLYLGGFAIAQLLWGPFSDRYGKGKAILSGLSIFVLTSVGIFFTKDIVVLLGLRLLQAIGACSAAVCWQALVIDRYPESETHKIFASIMPLVALSPALSPLVGVYISHHFGWRYIFIILALIAFMLILYTLSLSKSSSPGTKAIIEEKSYQSFFQSKKYLGYVMIYAFSSAGFFAWLTGCPFFLKELGYSESEIGLSFVPQTIAFMAGGYGYRLLANKIDGKRYLPYLVTLYSVCMVTLLLIGVFTIPTLSILLVPFCFMALANGAANPIVVAQALTPFAENSGKASALQNTLQLGTCFVASGGVSLFSQHALIATCIVMVSTVFFVILGLRLIRD